jgi:hypothetical protein
MADGGELLLDSGRRVAARLLLDPGRDVQRPDFIQRLNSAPAAPVEELADRAGVGPASVRILRRLDAKNSTKRVRARSLAAATSVGNIDPEVIDARLEFEFETGVLLDLFGDEPLRQSFLLNRT